MSTGLQTKDTDKLSVWVRTEDARSQIVAAVSDVMNPDTFIAHAMVSLNDPKFSDCSVRSKSLALMEMAALGLLATLKQVALIRRENKTGAEVTLMPQWQGYKAVMERHPAVLEVTVQIVHKNDSFGFKQGVLVHDWQPLDPGRQFSEITDLLGGYVTIYYRDGRPPKYHVVTARHIAKCRACAQTQNVWKNWFEQMVLKTIYRDCYARRAVPVDPLVSARLEKLIASDDMILGNDPRRADVELLSPPTSKAADLANRLSGAPAQQREPAGESRNDISSDPPAETSQQREPGGDDAPRPSDDDAILLDQWSDLVRDTDSIEGCNALERDKWPQVPEALKSKVLDLIGQRREAIRGSRGDRSNGASEGKPSQPSTDPLEWTRQQAAKCVTFGDWRKLDGQITAAAWSDETRAKAREIVSDTKAARKGGK
jgi:hypothetical protein